MDFVSCRKGTLLLHRKNISTWKIFERCILSVTKGKTICIEHGRIDKKKLSMVDFDGNRRKRIW